jgi:hypothetical protein
MNSVNFFLNSSRIMEKPANQPGPGQESKGREGSNLLLFFCQETAGVFFLEECTRALS